ncbi:MAG: UvrD-helicase domain-containing protein, partial [Proteobacteria bacterium]|nr:UvrD-helicase domain-containing protein [Pseudomonadota bacterium]
MAEDTEDNRDTGAVSDKREREQALDPSRSFIVQAPAGSGKTALLIQRFLLTLSYVSRPEEVLAITFTKKAASEMHERIYGALVRAEAGTVGNDENSRAELDYARAALERSSELGWDLVENPARLQVQTIDSFSAALARRMPLMSKL